MTMTVDVARVRAFRAARHHLTERRPIDDVLAVVGACGIQNTPPWAAGVALGARLDGFTLDAFDRAVSVDRTLTQSWCMRGAPFLFPTNDIDVFTTGLLPDTERDIRAFVVGVKPALDALEMSAIEAVDRTEATLPRILSGRQLPIDPLGKEIADTIAEYLPLARRRTWDEPGPYSPGQPLGEGVVHFVLRISTLKQTICFAPRSGNKAPFVLTSEWLGDDRRHTEQDEARRELLRRYLRRYGPSNSAGFAAWAGISPQQASDTWDLLAEELTSVRGHKGGTTWVLGDDVGALESASVPDSVRLLPPSDPYLRQQDRDTILDDTTRHPVLWRTVGAPGAVLRAGRVVGVWNARKRGRRLDLTVRPFEPLPEGVRSAVAAEADVLAPLRGAERVALSFTEERTSATG
ncbi:AlkZ family DNA glycosylase [Spiractinospora alimapuensis]|uniref:winged helix DNA-binding domain-containing protein n=1 Tax=Spiractinospora alimapuensis TaxID=2820884 RepID=UPI001F254EA7|nr:winged helix DNA-binding domain-containing protein [Spiractinospora alimapuensis]QVQ51186.1 AlkZ family DNA glycosylase [Spiractinospora alimapuensis]